MGITWAKRRSPIGASDTLKGATRVDPADLAAHLRRLGPPSQESGLIRRPATLVRAPKSSVWRAHREVTVALSVWLFHMCEIRG